MDIASLNKEQIDALREVGNIGAGHAATALSTMIGRRIAMNVPKANILDLAAASELIGGSEIQVCAVYLEVSGDVPGHVLFILPKNGSKLIVDLMLGRTPGSTVELDELSYSALGELGNILVANCLVAMGDLTRLNLIPSPPALAFDMVGAILDGIVTELSMASDSILVLETDFTLAIEDFPAAEEIQGYFLFFPDAGSVDKMLRALGCL